MNISGLPSDLTQPARDTDAAPEASRDEFLRLLVAQLSNQDPLSPQDGSEFVAQLAQFAALEQNTETNQRLSELQSEQASASRVALSGLVGKKATANASSIDVDGSRDPLELSVDLEERAVDVEIIITDDTGNHIKTVNLGRQAEGDFSFTLDGSDLEEGRYHIEVRAKRADGTEFSGDPFVHGVLDAINFENGGASFRLGSVEIVPADILSVER